MLVNGLPIPRRLPPLAGVGRPFRPASCGGPVTGPVPAGRGWRSRARHPRVAPVAGSRSQPGRPRRFDTRVSGVDQQIRPTLVVPAGTEVAKAHRLLEKAEAEAECLITNSLVGTVELETSVTVEG